MFIFKRDCPLDVSAAPKDYFAVATTVTVSVAVETDTDVTVCVTVTGPLTFAP